MSPHDASATETPGLQEARRLAALGRYDVLDSPQDAVFDRITEMAGLIYGTPVALITLVDRHRIRFPSRIGLDVQELPRAGSFCDHVVETGEPQIIADVGAAAGPAAEPTLLAGRRIGFYAGAPLHTPDGH